MKTGEYNLPMGLKGPNNLAQGNALGKKATRQPKVGKGQAGGQPLPVVAVGLIPHIYRRASFTHRATPKRLPREGSSVARLLRAASQ